MALNELTTSLGEARELVHNRPFFPFREFNDLTWTASQRLNDLRNRGALTAAVVIGRNRIRDIIDIYNAIKPTNAMFHCVARSDASDVYERIKEMMNIFVSTLHGDTTAPGVQDAIDDLEVTMAEPDNGWNEDHQWGFNALVDGHVEDNEANRVRGALEHQKLIRFLEQHHQNVLRQFRDGLVADVAAGDHPDEAVNVTQLNDFGHGNF